MTGLAVAPKAPARDMYSMLVGVHHHHHYISRSQRKNYSAWINPKPMVLLVGHMSTGVTSNDQDVSRIAVP